MTTALKYIAAGVLLFTGAACGGSDSEPDNPSPILGKWSVYAWENNGKFVNISDGSYFAFYESGAYVYYNGALLNKYVTGDYSYNSTAGVIHCSEAKGYSMTINVVQSGDSATFAWHYDVTPENVTTIKVKRN